MNAKYHYPKGGLPPQHERLEERAIFTEAYAFIPGTCLTDIVTSHLPGWAKTRLWVLARPLSGFAETFSQYIMKVEPGGGAQRPEPDPGAQAVLFVVDGMAELTIEGQLHHLRPGSYAYLPPALSWSLANESDNPVRFHWIRKLYEKAEGIDVPEPFITNEQDISPTFMPDTDGKWSTTRFVDPLDLRHDMHVNIVNFEPEGRIPFPEIHVMEHGLFVLQGRGAYKLNQDWIDVEAGDFMWLRAFCPQACVAHGSEPFRYLLYKDVNRHARLG